MDGDIVSTSVDVDSSGVSSQNSLLISCYPYDSLVDHLHLPHYKSPWPCSELPVSSFKLLSFWISSSCTSHHHLLCYHYRRPSLVHFSFYENSQLTCSTDLSTTDCCLPSRTRTWTKFPGFYFKSYFSLIFWCSCKRQTDKACCLPIRARYSFITTSTSCGGIGDSEWM